MANAIWYQLTGDSIHRVDMRQRQYRLDNGWPTEAVILSDASLDHPDRPTTLYFSPAAATFAQQLGATPCEAPEAANVHILIGDEAVVARLLTLPF